MICIMYKEIGILFKKATKAPTGDLKLPLGKWFIRAYRKKATPKLIISDIDEVPTSDPIDKTITNADKSADNSLF